MKKSKLSVIDRYNRNGYLFVLPWILGFLLLFLSPLIQTIQFSLSEVTTSPKGYVAQFVNLKNFLYIFTEDAQFPRLLTNSIVSMLVDIPVLLVFSFFVAVLLKDKFRGISVVKSIFFITVILSSGIFIRMQGETIASNTIQINSAMNDSNSFMQTLKGINIEKYLIDAGVSESLVGYIMTPVNTLFSVMTRSGIQIFIFLAGLSSISPSLYEASSMEGASKWETFWIITFPMTSPLIIVNLVYSIVDSFTSYNNGSLNYIYSQAFEKLNYGYASALSWTFFIVVGAIIAISTWIISKSVYYDS